jgi:lipopolysaccharide heptosyltransferase II
LRILLVRLRLIGDVVFTTPAISMLRRRYPNAHLAYLVEAGAAPVVQGNPNLNELIVIPRRAGLARVRDDIALARRLRHGRFDIAIDMHGGPRGAWLTWASRAPMRIGYAIKGRTWMYTHPVARAAELLPRHSVQNQCDLLAPLGAALGAEARRAKVAVVDPLNHPVEMTADPAAEARVEQRLKDAGIAPDAPLVIVHVSATNPFRRWPAHSFVTLVAGLVHRDARRRIYLFSGPADADTAQRIAAQVRAHLGGLAAAVPDLGDFDLAEIRALARRAAVYIGGDSGPMHIAATTSVPIVGIVGPTLAERSRPWRDPRLFSEMIDGGPLPCRPCHQRQCVPGDFRCLTGISADRVLAAAERGMQHA